jgi:hypothetical protein
MTVQNYLSGQVSYRNDVGVTDVTTIITNLVALALAASPAWTNPSGNTIVSPADASGRQMTLAFSRISATQLQVIATDGQSRSVTRRANIAGGGSSIFYYLGQFHCVLDWLNGASGEGLHCVMLDETPELQTSHNRWLSVHGIRDGSGSSLGDWFVLYNAIVDSTNAFVEKFAWLYPQATARAVTHDGLAGFRTPGGSNILYPVIQMGDSTSGIYKIFGKLYQHLICSATRFSQNSEFTVPLDDSTTGVFKVLYVPADGTDQMFLAVRKS